MKAKTKVSKTTAKVVKSKKPVSAKAKTKNTVKNTKKPVSRGTAVIQMTPRGRRIRKYPSISAAANATGVNSGSISYVIREMRNTAGGFKWATA